jgi:glutathione S-transferase
MNMSDLIFYTNPMSRGRIVRWMLEEIGCEYKTEIIAYDGSMKSEPFITINPMGKIPVISHQGKIITETPAILAYLADAFPEAGLAPVLNQRADYYRWFFFAAGPLEAAVTNKRMGFEVNEEQEIMAGYGSYDRVVDTLTKTLNDSTYLCGGQFTAADVYLGSHLGWGMQFGTLPKAPEFEAYYARLSEREAWQRANDLDNALMPEEKSE